MTWVNLFSWLVKLATGLLEYYSTRQLLKAGQAEAVADLMRETNARIQKALNARRAVLTDSLSDNEPDKYRRD